ADALIERPAFGLTLYIHSIAFESRFVLRPPVDRRNIAPRGHHATHNGKRGRTTCAHQGNGAARAVGRASSASPGAGAGTGDAARGRAARPRGEGYGAAPRPHTRA